MTITSFTYLLLVTVGVLLYYILPKSWQWIVLLVLSMTFYYYASSAPYTIVFILISTMSAYVATNFIQLESIKRSKIKSLSSVIIAFAIIVNLGFWLVLKGSDLWVSLSYRSSLLFPFIKKLSPVPVLAALGMGYYTLQVIGYILDCYWGTIQPQKNPIKLLLFVSFFPQLITGPISRYEDLGSLYQKHTFSYENVTHGTQRILWGLFKKLVISERVGILVNGIWGDLGGFSGYYHWIALLLYPIQMYSDFSGCMDIVIGTAELFGIRLTENFNNPFFSRTVQEFWQRWHITLGTWAKDYVLYPLLKSREMIKLGKKTKKKFGKRIGKFIPTAVGMFTLWGVMGLWHGNFKYVIGVSLWYWLILMLGELCKPCMQKVMSFSEINPDCFSWRLFQSIRTYLIYAVGAVFFRAEGVGRALLFLKSLCNMFWESGRNGWIFFDGSILNLGITYGDLNILMLGIFLLIIVALLRERYGFARIWMDQQIFIFRWMVWLGLFLIVLIFGKYGPGYSAAEFIYQGF